MEDLKYPLGEHEKSTITSKTGKYLHEITLEEVKKGNVTTEDIKISKETLLKHAMIAKKNDNPPMELNFKRAAELVDVPDEVIMQMYDALRPNRSTKEDLIKMAENLLHRYNAPFCAKLVLEAVEIYEKRGILL